MIGFKDYRSMCLQYFPVRNPEGKGGGGRGLKSHTFIRIIWELVTMHIPRPSPIYSPDRLGRDSWRVFLTSIQ